MEKISGVSRGEAIGRLLMGELFGGLLRFKGQDLTKFMIVLNKAIDGMDTDKFPFVFLNKQVNIPLSVAVFLSWWLISLILFLSLLSGKACGCPPDCQQEN